MSAENLHVGVIGATGAVGVELINVMFDRNFPVGELKIGRASCRDKAQVPERHGVR